MVSREFVHQLADGLLVFGGGAGEALRVDNIRFGEQFWVAAFGTLFGQLEPSRLEPSAALLLVGVAKQARFDPFRHRKFVGFAVEAGDAIDLSASGRPVEVNGDNDVGPAIAKIDDDGLCVRD